MVMARQGSGMQQPGMNGQYQGAPQVPQQHQQQQQQPQQQQQQYVYNGEPMYVQPMGRQPSGGHGYPAEAGPQQHQQQHAVYK